MTSAATPPVPGAPGSEPPTLAEPTTPRPPPDPKPDQGVPAPVTATGGTTDAGPKARGQHGEYLTTSTGLRLRDTDHSLRAGARGPSLLQDHHLREKITHFDHERIPERVVHARGAGAHGVFTSYGTASRLTRAAFLGPDVETPVFVRFSTVLGSRGSADTVRDTRGFATKFYTEEGTFDLVRNNMPVFFIQDGIKFPDVIHAAKPHPDREVPQAQSAHDTFWDFVSLHTEAQHHTIWNMSDRGIPRSYRTMEGFGVHTFRLVDAEGGTSLVKFHWKPRLGVHSLVWEEAQMLAGIDPDFHRRDLYDAIESGAFPQWELGVQVFPDTPEQVLEGIDLLDPTKFVPEEVAEVQPVGLLTLNANPTNFFAQVEQVAFHLGNLVPGIDVTDDPLLHARLFSYIDTQLTRLGGPNFNQIPINRPHAPVNDMLRDGFHQHAVHSGVAPYKPNSLDGGVPFAADVETGAFLEVPAPVAASAKVRESPVSFEDHYSQARLFWRSMTPVEQDHIVQAYTFELGKCYETAIRERQLGALANIDSALCAAVAAELGMPAPSPSVPEEAAGGTPAKTVEDGSGGVAASPALSQVGRAWPVEGRMVGIVVAPTSDLTQVQALSDAVRAGGALPLLIAPVGGPIGTGGTGPQAQRTFLTARSAELDAVILAAAPPPGPDAKPSVDAKADPGLAASGIDPRVALLVSEAFRHAKGVGAVGDGVAALAAIGIAADAAGVSTGSASIVAGATLAGLARHRAWERFPVAAV
ncbi:MAG TPA: catalase [Dermatophilaceae bacterium]|nr:catalase [Dermatophilaceae bacterium]